MTKNRRYEAHYDRLNDERIAQASQSGPPATLPHQAWGPTPLTWATRDERAAVWAWVQWAGRPAERIACVATAWNDRVVIVEWEAVGGLRDTVVWRNAVTRRERPAPTRR